MQFLILGWLVLDITNSSSQLGLVILAFGLPNLLFAFFGGIIADRSSRLKLLISTRLCVSVLIFALAILRIAGVLEIWHVYAISALLGTVQALNGPARMAIVADLVDRDHLMNAVALHGMVNQTGQILGPAAAGGIIELVGIGPTLLVNGGYPKGMVVNIDDLPRESWRVDGWAGPAFDVDKITARIEILKQAMARSTQGMGNRSMNRTKRTLTER